MAEKTTYRVPADEIQPGSAPKPKYGGTVVSAVHQSDGSVVVTESFSGKQKLTQAARQIGADAAAGARVVGKGVYTAGKTGATVIGKTASITGRYADGQLHKISAMGQLDVNDQMTNAARGVVRKTGAAGKRILSNRQASERAGKHAGAGRAIISQAAGAIRDGGTLDAEHAAATTSVKIWRKSTKVIGKAGGRAAYRTGTTAVKYTAKGARYTAKGTMQAARLAVKGAQYAATAVKALVTAIGAAGSILPLLIGIIGIVAALCAILPSFITGAGAENHRRQQAAQPTCVGGATPGYAVTAAEVVEFLPNPGGVDASDRKSVV